MPTQRCKCGAKYRFADGAVGKRAKCKTCGTVFVLHADEETGIIAIAPEEDAGGSPGGDAEAPTPDPTAHLPTSDAPPIIDPRHVRSTPEAGVAMVPHGYWSSVLGAFLFPANSSNLVTFVVVWCVMALLPFIGRIPGMGLILSLLITGWFAAFRFDVIASAAAGERDLPTLGGSGDMFFDMLASAMKWIGSWIVVFLPALPFLTLLVNQGQATPSDVVLLMSRGLGNMLTATGGDLVLFTALVCFGIFLWPIVVLCVALGGFESLFRIDLIAVTIVRTLPTYCLTVAVMFGAVFALHAFMGAASSGVAGDQPGIGGEGFGGLILFVVARAGLAVYLSIVQVRLIGLYYYHARDRFAWSWE